MNTQQQNKGRFNENDCETKDYLCYQCFICSMSNYCDKWGFKKRRTKPLTMLRLWPIFCKNSILFQQCWCQFDWLVYSFCNGVSGEGEMHPSLTQHHNSPLPSQSSPSTCVQSLPPPPPLSVGEEDCSPSSSLVSMLSHSHLTECYFQVWKIFENFTVMCGFFQLEIYYICIFVYFLIEYHAFNSANSIRNICLHGRNKNRFSV